MFKGRDLCSHSLLVTLVCQLTSLGLSEFPHLQNGEVSIPRLLWALVNYLGLPCWEELLRLSSRIRKVKTRTDMWHYPYIPERYRVREGFQ